MTTAATCEPVTPNEAPGLASPKGRLTVIHSSATTLQRWRAPSTGTTRLHRYYEPLRHPRAPGLSVTGHQLVVPDHAKGLPVLRALLVYVLSPLPRHSPCGPASQDRLRLLRRMSTASSGRRPMAAVLETGRWRGDFLPDGMTASGRDRQIPATPRSCPST